MHLSVCMLAILVSAYSLPNDDPCENYNILDEEWRNRNYGSLQFCDINRVWHGWYRFMGKAGNKMADDCSSNNCGGNKPMYIAGGHPQEKDGVVKRRLCTYYYRDCCATNSYYSYLVDLEYVQVRKCPGGYFIYNFPTLQELFNRVFCGVKDTTDPCLDANCTHGCVAKNGQAQCTCPNDVLNSDTRDICVNPCSHENGGCSHICNKTETGSRVCSCPNGMELSSDGKTCVDPCLKYRVLDQEWRNVRYSADQRYRDELVSWEGWYRFQGQAGNKMADTCPTYNHCGGNYPMWLTGGHPNVIDSIVDRKICTRTSSSSSTASRYCCPSDSYFTFDVAKVKKCPGGYFVYKLPHLQRWNNRVFCGATDTSDPCMNSTCTGGCENQDGIAKCICPTGLKLSTDGRTCLSACEINNGGCSHICRSNESNANAATCSCPHHLVLALDGATCVSPCLYNNGGCSHFCTDDGQGDVTCKCPANLILGRDNNTCISTCNINNGGCSHYCNESDNGAICICPPGLELGDDKLTCDQDADECKSNPCSQNATCINTPGSYQCVCNKGFEGDGMVCKGETPLNTKTRRCQCRLRAETTGTTLGSILFDLPTLIYGHKTLWATDIYGNENAAYVITDKYPDFYNTRRRAIVDTDDLLTCLKVLRNCPADCERLSKIIIGDNLGFDTELLVENSAGKNVSKTMGQVMCETYNHSIDPPGKRVVVFFNPGSDCGQELSTYASEAYLCCKSEEVSGIGKLTFWNRKCSEGVTMSELLVG